MRPFQAVILDLDGTMIDSEPASRRVWQELLGRYGREVAEADILWMVGKRTDVSAAYLRERYDLPLTLEELLAEKDALWSAVWRRGLPARPGLDVLTRHLGERGIPWGVGTASPRGYAEGVLDQLGLRAACRTVVGGDEVAASKPHPQTYLLAAERLGVEPAACLVVEDSGPGAQAGLSAGMTVVAIPTPLTDLTTLPPVHHRLGSLAEVVELLMG